MANDQYDDYRVPGTPMVAQKQFTCYHSQGDQSLYAIIETYSDGYRWNLNSSWLGDSDAEIEETVTTTTQLRVKNSQETESHWNLGAQYEGLTIGIGGSLKTFQEYETTTTTEHKQLIRIPPRKNVFLYQKAYRFNFKIWFILDAWNEMSRVGGHGNYTPSVVTGSLEIDAHDYYTRDSKLEHGSSTTSADSVASTVTFDHTRKFENCTERCKNYLLDHGVKPPS